MTLTRTLRAVIVGSISAAALLLAGCGSGVQSQPGASDTTAQTSDAFPVTIDNCEVETTYEQAPTKLVGLSPSQTELLVEMGLADQLVGQAQTATYALPAAIASEVSNVPELSDTMPPTREVLLATEPDFVYSPTTYEFTESDGFASVAQLNEAGANTYVATGGCAERRTTAVVDDLFVDIENLGAIFDRADAATELSDAGKARLEAVSTAIEGQQKPTVAQLYIEGTTISAIGAGVEYDIINQSGGENAFQPDESLFAQFFAAQIGPEEISARNPEAIVFTVNDDAHEQQVREYLQTTFPDVTAVIDDKLIAVPGSSMFPGTLGNITAVETIAAGLYPAQF